MAEWYQLAGFRKNPLTVKPGLFERQLNSIDQPLLALMAQNSSAFVKAPMGRGKTTLLKHIIAEFGGQRKIIYYSHLPGEVVPLEKLIRDSSRLRKHFGHVPRDLILLFDEAQGITPKEAAVVAGFLHAGNIRSAVFFGTKFRKSCFPPPLRKVLEKNTLQLHDLTAAGAMQLVHSRLGGKVLTEQAVRELYQVSAGNPRRLLQLCEQACHRFVHAPDDKVSAAQVKKMLGEKGMQHLELSQLSAQK